MRCARCGNENPGTNRFCGMCGATLLQAPAAAAPNAAPPAQSFPPASVAPPVPQPPVRPVAPAPARPAPVAEETPSISGPSFLGLNQPGSSEPRRRGSLSIDPNSAPSGRSLDYLLEDDHEHRSGGALKFFLILLALALAVGFGYLRFKDQGLAWLKGSTNKPPAAQSTEAPDSASPPAPANADHATPAPQNAQPAAALPIATDSSAANPSSANPSSTTPSSATAPATAPANPAASATPSSAPPAGEDAGLAPAAAKPATPPPAAKTSTAPDSNSDSESDTDSETPAPTGKPKARAPAAKPAAAIAQPRIDNVAEAQKYIYGRGVRQDCDRGMRLLKPAADQANPKAMIEMGALYSAGLCTPRDLPTAYRWFALALRKDPENQSVQTDLQKLWGEMTQPERQLAIKLSQ